jgi:hypothetical protein
MPIQNGNEPPILYTTSWRSCLFRTATNHQYSAQHLNVHAYSDRQQTTNTVHNISTFMAIQTSNEPQYWWFVAVLNRHERWDVVHSIGGLLPVWISMNVEMLCMVLVVCCRSEWAWPATNHQYCAQHLNVHGYSDWQRTTNTVHNISMFMPIQKRCCAQYWWFVASLNSHERWDVVHSIGGLLPFWIYSERQRTTNTMHNISMFMPIQTGNKPPILCTTSQRSCLFRTARNHQYCAQHLNVHAYSEWRWDVVHGIGGSLPFWIGMNVEMLCTVLVVSCRSE